MDFVFFVFVTKRVIMYLSFFFPLLVYFNFFAQTIIFAIHKKNEWERPGAPRMIGHANAFQ